MAVTHASDAIDELKQLNFTSNLSLIIRRNIRGNRRRVQEASKANPNFASSFPLLERPTRALENSERKQ